MASGLAAPVDLRGPLELEGVAAAWLAKAEALPVDVAVAAEVGARRCGMDSGCNGGNCRSLARTAIGRPAGSRASMLSGAPPRERPIDASHRQARHGEGAHQAGTRRPRRQHTRAYSDPRTRASPATSGGARVPRLFRECVIIGVHRPVWMKRLPPVDLDDAAEGFAGSADRNPRREPPLFASIVSRRSCHLMKCDFVRLSRRPARVVRRDEVSRPS